MACNIASSMTSNEFYKGHNIIKTLQNSSFGKIKTIFEQLVDEKKDILKDYTLPKVLFIGIECAGKSSLVENITKCQIFPRGKGFCTKAPVHLVLKNGVPSYTIKYSNPVLGIDENVSFDDKFKIHEKVESIMKMIPSANISELEILIEIMDNDMPNFEFIDLPGIKEFPKELSESTTNITKKYLENNRDAIIICVVPSITTSLTSCRSIAFVKEYEMEQNCILALTMMDRLHTDMIDDFLVSRLIGTSDEIANFNFAGIVGVINRSHSNALSLIDNDMFEEQWIKDNVINRLSTDNIHHKEIIMNHTTLPVLLQIMDNIYNKCIQTVWKPKIIESLTQSKNTVNDQILDLGVETFPHTQVKELYDQFFAHLLTRIRPAATKFSLYTWRMKFAEEINVNTTINPPAFAATEPLIIPIKIATHENLCMVEPDINNTCIDNMINIFTIKKNIKTKITKSINELFESVITIIKSDFDKFHSSVKTYRFSKILAKLLSIVESLSTESNEMIDMITSIVDTYLNNCALANTPINDDNLSEIIANLILSNEKMLLTTNFDKFCCEPHIFTEDPSHAEIRLKLVENLNNYDLCLTKIKETI